MKLLEWWMLYNILVDALHHHEEFGEVCPANWSKGKESMKESHDAVADYLAKH